MTKADIKKGCAAFSFFLLAACSGGSSSPSPTPTPTPTPAPQEAAEVTWLKQNAQEFSSTDPSNEDYTDLASFGAAAGNTTIVAIGEQDHTSGTSLDLKTRLVKYLHEKKGFDVLMIESGMFDVSRIWQLMQTGQHADDVGNDAIFSMYSRTSEGRKVLQYVDSQYGTAHPLILAGMDSNLYGNLSRTDLFPMFEAFLGPRSSSALASPEWANYKAVALLAMHFTQTRPAQNELDDFYAASTQLESELCSAQADTYAFPDSPSFWCLTVKGLRDEVDRYFNVAGFNVGGMRDTHMAENANWLMDHGLAGHKIIIWAHIAHIFRFRTADPTYWSMGTVLDATYGRKIYVANITASEGTVLDIRGDTTYSMPAGYNVTRNIDADLAGSVEDILRQLGKPYQFVDATLNSPPAAFATMTAKNFDFFAGLPTGLACCYDGLFYVRTTTPVTINR